MQSSTPTKPVMDVMAPAQTAVTPAPPLTATEVAGQKQAEVAAAASRQAAASVPEPAAPTTGSTAAEPAKEQNKPVTKTSAAAARRRSAKPVGIIVTTIFVMIALSALTILVYLKSQAQ